LSLHYALAEVRSRVVRRRTRTTRPRPISAAPIAPGTSGSNPVNARWVGAVSTVGVEVAVVPVGVGVLDVLDVLVEDGVRVGVLDVFVEDGVRVGVLDVLVVGGDGVCV
jgi:hypothetical protein